MIFAHALGNPFHLTQARRLCEQHGLWLIEDNCDALGSLYQLPGSSARWTGTFGDLSTQSFYPPHHVTRGEGGAVTVVRHAPMAGIVESFRDWGRDCWCPSGQNNTCGKRFGWQLGEMPEGYDQKYIYRHLGYNLKPTDIHNRRRAAAAGAIWRFAVGSTQAIRKRSGAPWRSGRGDAGREESRGLPRACLGDRQDYADCGSLPIAGRRSGHFSRFVPCAPRAR